MRQQFVDAVARMLKQPLEDVLQIRPRLMPVQARGLHQAHHHRRALAGEFAASKEPCFPAHRPGPHQVLDVVVVDGHVAVVQEPSQGIP